MSTLSIGSELGERLKSAGHTVAVAESSSGGLIAATLLAVPGASAYFKGGTVIYSLESRYELLRTSRDELRGLGRDREKMALHFARRARELLDATWGISELGLAGPTGSPNGDPAGLTVIAVDGPVSRAARIETGDADRQANMWRFTEEALRLLSAALDELSRSVRSREVLHE